MIKLHINRLLVLVLSVFLHIEIYSQTPIFVRADGLGGGTSWNDACSLDSAMVLAQKEPSQVWLKEGLYFLGQTLQVPDFTEIFGGFSGSETTLSERNYAQNKTILDAQRSFAAVHLGYSAMLNGLAVINGYAYLAPTPYGGGIWMEAGARVENCYVLDNRASDYGGGVYAEGDGLVYNTLFSGNNAGLDGLAIWGSTLDVRNVTVSENYRWGDAVTVDSNRCNILTPAWAILGKASFVTDSVWLVDTLLWSDAVTVTTCQKTMFDGGYLDPPTFHADCRSNPGYRGDLFSWCAVKKFGEMLCPKPWRVPSVEDFIAMDLSFGGNGEDRMIGYPPNLPLVNDHYLHPDIWRGTLAGACLPTGGIGVQQGMYAHYWSQSLFNDTLARHLYLDITGLSSPQWSTHKYHGFSLRCTRFCPRVTLDLANDASTRHQTICLNEPVETIRHTWNNTVTKITLSWDTIPEGIIGDSLAFSGTPVKPGVYRWTITAIGDSTCPPNISTGTITVNPLPARVTVTTATNPACDSAILVASNGNDGTIFWQNTTANGTSTALATDTQTVKTSGTYYFRARSDEGCWGESGSVEVDMVTIPTILTHPDMAEQSMVQGDVEFPELSVSASGFAPITYQWYSNKTNSNLGGTAISGATNTTFLPSSSVFDTSYYYCVVSNPCGSITSNVSGRHSVEPFIVDTNGCNNATPGWGNSLGVVSFTTDSIWVVGNQVWSDAVQTSVCSNRTAFYGGRRFDLHTDTMNYYTDCRSNPEHPGDFFSWCAVMRFANMLCPAPWRVPTVNDFVILDTILGGNGFSGQNPQQNGTLYNNYFNLWGAHLGESVRRGGPHSSGYYWTSDSYSTVISRFSICPFGGAFHICRQHYSVDFLDYGVWNEKSDGFSLRCVRDTTIPVDSTLILDVSLENLDEGLIDRSVYHHPQIGGVTGVEEYSEGGVKLLARGGFYSFPKWAINVVLPPYVLEYEVKRFSDMPGHGSLAYFDELEYPNSSGCTHFDHALTSGRTANFSALHSCYFSIWPNFSPTVPVDKWVKVRIEYGKPNAGSGEVKTYFDGVLQNTATIPTGYMAKQMKSFALGSDQMSAHDAANAAIRNLKIWIVK